MKHLSLNVNYFSKHAQAVMKDLGITYQLAVPQSMYDSWWFFNCDNIPKELPNGLRELNVNPNDLIGDGLSKEDADNINSSNKEGNSGDSY